MHQQRSGPVHFDKLPFTKITCVFAGSKASLVSLQGNSSDSTPGFSSSGAGPPQSTDSTVPYASSSGRFLGAAPTNSSSSAMLPTSTEPRTRMPLVGAGKSSRWVVAGYSVDYALDWALVIVMGIVLAASEAGVPREGAVQLCFCAAFVPIVVTALLTASVRAALCSLQHTEAPIALKHSSRRFFCHCPRRAHLTANACTAAPATAALQALCPQRQSSRPSCRCTALRHAVLCCAVVHCACSVHA